MYCPRDKKLALALGSVILGLIFWVSGMAVDSKLDKPAAEILVLMGTAMICFALICGACSAQQRLASSLSHRLLNQQDEENSGMMRQRVDGRLSPVLET